MPATIATKPSPPTAHAISSRASWAGQLSLGPLAIPVKAYPALVPPSAGPLHQIHINCGQRLNQRKICPTHGEVTNTEIGKSFEYGPNYQLPITDADLQELAPADDHTIHIDSLLSPDHFEFALFSGRALYLIAAHVAAAPNYAQAAIALRNRNVWAIGSMVLSDVRRPIGVHSDGRRLVLHVLHFPEYRRAYPGAEAENANVSAQEVRALEKALLPLYKSFSWDRYRDEGNARLTALIAAKIASRDQQSVKPNAPASGRSKKAVARKGTGKRFRQAA